MRVWPYYAPVGIEVMTLRAVIVILALVLVASWRRIWTGRP